jgi:hypothetical protein
MRWDNYFLKSDSDFISFWNSYQANDDKDILFIMGLGFDPRTCLGIETVFSRKTKRKRDTVLLRYYKNQEEINDPVKPKVKEHIDRLTTFLRKGGFTMPTERNIFMRSEDDKSIVSVNATFIIPDFSMFENYTDVVIDISAMPRGVFIPLINKCLDLVDLYNAASQEKKNFHVIATENSLLDSMIQDKGVNDEASYIHGFRIKGTASTIDQKQVWIPILGEKQITQFDIIKTELNPVEVCPVLPFPSENLKRGDNLIIEYQDKLLNDVNFEIKNIVYADEANPFQVYRLLNRTIKRYRQSFELLNGCKVIVSALSSKLLTMGAFMAVYEAKRDGANIGIMHVESLGHDLEPAFEEQKMEIAKHNKLFEIWLAGTPYNE